jgi:membrane protease YdiL (CAAX protease family)
VLTLSLGRATALHLGIADILAGSVFAAALLALALALPGVREGLIGIPRVPALALGIAAGAALLFPGASMRGAGAAGLGTFLGEGQFPMWAALIALISAAEEITLRGWLQPLARQAFGPGPAIIAVAALFAAIHAGTYGWIALPLDFGVGVLLGCLREHTHSVAACGLAHFVADIGHWWLP